MKLIYGQAISKPPSYPAEVPWHQNGIDFVQGDKRNLRQGISCWITIGESFSENGSVMYLPGRHKYGLLVHESTMNWLELANALHIPNVDASTAISTTMHPGDAVFHHSLCLHMWPGNQPSVSRDGLASHFGVA